MKNDHRSEFSNLSNWKEEAWKKNQGFNGIRTRDLRVADALLYQLSWTHAIQMHDCYCIDSIDRQQQTAEFWKLVSLETSWLLSRTNKFIYFILFINFVKRSGSFKEQAQLQGPEK